MNRCQGIDSASLRSLAGRYNNPIPTRFLGYRLFQNSSTVQTKICILFGRMCRSSGCGRYVPEDEILAATPLASTGNYQLIPLNFNLFLAFLYLSEVYCTWAAVK
jgi:hypothetical protein